MEQRGKYLSPHLSWQNGGVQRAWFWRLWVGCALVAAAWVGGAMRTHCCGHCPAPGSRQGHWVWGWPPPGLCPLLPGGNMWPQALRLCWGQRRQEGPGHLALGFCRKRPRTQKVKAIGEVPRAHNVPRRVRGLNRAPPGASGPESLGASLSSLGQGQVLALVGGIRGRAPNSLTGIGVAGTLSMGLAKLTS